MVRVLVHDVCLSEDSYLHTTEDGGICRTSDSESVTTGVSILHQP